MRKIQASCLPSSCKEAIYDGIYFVGAWVGVSVGPKFDRQVGVKEPLRARSGRGAHENAIFTMGEALLCSKSKESASGLEKEKESEFCYINKEEETEKRASTNRNQEFEKLNQAEMQICTKADHARASWQHLRRMEMHLREG